MTKIEELEKQRAEIEAEIEKLKRDITASDPIYLMSITEYEKYKDKIPQWHYWWWLRTPAYYSTYATYIHGGVYGGDSVNNMYGGIRPVLNEANMSEEDQECITIIDNDRISLCGIVWVRLDGDFWIAEVPIAVRRFDEKSNNYAESEIRQFLLDWYEERRKW